MPRVQWRTKGEVSEARFGARRERKGWLEKYEVISATLSSVEY